MRRSGRRDTLILVAILVIAVPSRGEEASRDATFQDALARLSEALAARARNLEGQEAAWPQAVRDASREAPAPAEVQALQAELRVIERRISDAQKRIEGLASDDLGPLCHAISEADDVALVEALSPVAAEVGKEDTSVAKALIAAARRFPPCPPRVAAALADLGVSEASAFLLSVGEAGKDPALLAAAARTGEATVVSRLADLADGGEGDLSAAALRAIQALGPPTRYNRGRVERIAESRIQDARIRDPKLRIVARLEASDEYTHELEALVATRIRGVRSRELECALITYLGLFRNRRNLGIFRPLYENEGDESVRLALLGAMGNAGASAGPFLLEELDGAGRSEAVQRTCVHALGSAGYRPAVRRLIDLLEDPQLEREAERALTRISGQELGRTPAAWLRWWRAQPEAPESDQDPEVAGVR